MDAFADTAVVALAEDLGEDDVIVQDVGEVAGDGAEADVFVGFLGRGVAAAVSAADRDGAGKGVLFVLGALLEGLGVVGGDGLVHARFSWDDAAGSAGGC